MASNGPTRRDVLKSGGALAGVAVLGGLSGCLDSIPFLGGDSALGNVPEDSEGAVYLSLDTVREDDATQAVADAYLANSYYEPNDFDGLLDQFEDQTDLDPEGAHELTGFAEYNDSGGTSDYGGAILRTDWAEDDLVDALEDSGPDLDEGEEAGKTVYEPEEDYGSWMGVIEEGTFVVGSEDAVVGSIELSAGEGEQMDQALRDAYSSTRDAPVRFVSVVPTDQFDDELGYGDNTVDLSAVDDIEHASGSIYQDGDVRGLSVTLTVDDGDAAGDLADTIEEVIEFYQDAVSEDSDIHSELDEIEVSEESSAATVTYEKDVDEIEDLVEEYAG